MPVAHSHPGYLKLKYCVAATVVISDTLMSVVMMRITVMMIADNALQWLITIWMKLMLIAITATKGYLTMVNYEAMTIMLMTMMFTNG